MLEDEDHASGDRVLPHGAHEKSSQTRSRFDRPPVSEDLSTADVVAFRGLFADVRPQGVAEAVRCTVRGRLETADSEDRTLLAVGDRIEFSRQVQGGGAPGDGVIERLLPRRNTIVRGDRRVQRFRHVIAANVDGVVLVASVSEPKLRPGIVDRFLVAASSQEIPASLVMNKVDLLREGSAKQAAQIEEFRALYECLGVKVFLTSAAHSEGLAPLLEHLSTGRYVLVGHSGVGKTTLLNALRPELELPVRPVNRKTGKGSHTTTVARLLSLSGGVEVIDTPGIRELDIIDVAAVDLEAHFPEMMPLLEACEMDNCAHRSEPGCAVIAGVEAGDVHARRYASYVKIRAALEKQESAHA